eukprot:SAG31_NODE_10253_length_1164_cov_1.323944_1_plen_142_part_10
MFHTHRLSLAVPIDADMAPPYGTCPPGDDQGFDKRNKISCSHPLCLAYPGNATHPGGCMHEGEIFTRWLQFGVFSSTFRTHCEACEIRVWMYPEPYRTQLFRAFHLRQALQPYVFACCTPHICLLVSKQSSAQHIRPVDGCR